MYAKEIGKASKYALLKLALASALLLLLMPTSNAVTMIGTCLYDATTNGEIYKVARKHGMLMMKEDAMLKSIEGIVPFTEVYNFSNETD